MLICPQCQFENSDTNKFCQSCGTSLTHKPCHECGNKVAFDALHCPNCEALTGTLLQAIVSITYSDSSVPSASANRWTTDATDEEATMPLLSISPPAQFSGFKFKAVPPATTETNSEPVFDVVLPNRYLDPQERYQLLEPLAPVDAGKTEFQARVLDRRPLQVSLLEALQNQPQTHLETADNRLQAAQIFPSMAEPYLELQSQLDALLPGIHDAWVQERLAILLLEDRSDWQQLVDLWREEQLPPQQIVFLLNEIVKLWAILEGSGCRQSLLVADNLIVDEDQVLCLKRLYLERSHQPLSLKNLGQLWQGFFEQSQQTYIGSLIVLLQQLQSGEIDTLDRLQGELIAIAQELQADFSRVSEMTDLDEDQPITVPELNATFNSPSPEIAALASNSTRFQSAYPERTSEVMDDQPTVVLPMQLFNLESAGLSDTGTQRNHNEDAFCIQTQIERVETKSGRTLEAKGLYILCDGMGGHAGGEVASALAVDTLRKYFQTHWFNEPEDKLPGEESIREAVRLANQAIYDVNQQQSRTGSGRMGTTLVLVLIQDTHVAVTHVGDSRLYAYSRKQGLSPVTQDHDVGQREIQRGVEPNIAYSRPDAYQLTQALGPRSEDYIKPDIQFFDLNEDTLLLLSSDGLTDNDLLEKHWQTHIAPLVSSKANLDRGAGELIELANQQNGHDNVTVVLIRAKVRPNLDPLRE